MRANKFNLFLFNALDPSNHTLISKLVNGTIIITILSTVIAIMLGSDPNINRQYHSSLQHIEVFSASLFIIEYIARLYVAPLDPRYIGLNNWRARLRYALSFFAIIDFIAIVPFLLSFFYFDFRILRLLRLLRIFKLTRYNSAMNTLFTVIKQEMNSFISVIFVLSVVLIIAATGIYYCEHNAQPQHFGSILESMWWAIVTLTTVGYGDVYPITPLGKLFSAIIMIVGIGLIALPAGILASGFSDQLRKNQNQYKQAIKTCLKDGKISTSERKLLKNIQNRCNLSNEDVQEIEDIEHLKFLARNASRCPHCGRTDHDDD